MNANHWQVLVLFGDGDAKLAGPVEVEAVKDEREGSEPWRLLTYEPVGVRSHGTLLQIVTYAPPVGEDDWIVGEGDYTVAIHREMWAMHQVEFTWTGAVRVEGIELAEGGAAIGAAWEISPAPGAVLGSSSR